MTACFATVSRNAFFLPLHSFRESDYIEQPFDLPDAAVPLNDPDDSSDLDEFAPNQDDDDARWDVFIPDDDEFDPEPDPSDFWNDEFPNDE
jgi:hypothetical protein